MRHHLAALAAAVMLLGVAAPGCRASATEAESKTETPIAELSIDQVETLIKSERPPTVFDANGETTRKKFGTLPGAKLLSSASQYEPDAVLPSNKDTKLLFYCGSEACTAAKGAAKRASAAGWKDVNVMPAGIKGWSAAGKQTVNQS